MRYPIVLALGIAPFDEFYRSFLKTWSDWTGWRSDRYAYFRGVARELRSHGFSVEAPRARFAASVPDRAQDLASAVKEILANSGAERVHIISHSMGGLDARHMIVDEGMADSVATLTTIGTPHLGTSLADLGVGENGEVLEVLHSQVFAPLKISWSLIEPEEGANDGLVPVSSQQWTTELVGETRATTVERFSFPVEADHLNQLAWWDLDELSNASWWSFAAHKKIRDFERKILTIYLEIAQHADHLARS